ncbi:MAG: SGNH/GDSL hydrolase family protein, partial [Spirochaetia bacterium]|nr:SGNH/GDSL hydrolase family protein [Spirochaetia bacterium]
MSAFSLGAVNAATLFIPADDPRLTYSDYVQLNFVDAASGSGAKMARFDRIADMPGKGYQWDNPGTRLRFRTDAAKIQVNLYYSEKHISTSARNPVGRYFIDGKSEAAWTYTSIQKETVRKPEALAVEIAAPSPGLHDYEVILPYGDSVDVLGVTVDDSALFDPPSLRPAKRLVAYGDSITHGFTASEVTKSYAFLLAQKMNCQIVNMGLGGRGAAPAEGNLIAARGGDVVSVLIGVNDWQGGRKIETFKANFEGFLKN